VATRRRAAADPRQLWLDFDDTPREPLSSTLDSVFFAIRPDLATAARMAEHAEELRHRHGLRGRRRPTEILHVSLLGLGKYEELSGEFIRRAKQAASTIQLARFVVALDRVMSFGQQDNHPFVLRGEEGVVGLVALRQALCAAMAAAGLKLRVPSLFMPHLTLLYDRKLVPEMFLDEPLSWTVSDFVLVHSRHGKSNYENLGTWPLQDARSPLRD
jgi:RNA 2',3'-cyclic 3'-phosphodiesterase